MDEKVQGEINACKIILSQTDFMMMKYLDGELSDEEYSDLLELRRKCRATINELENSSPNIVSDAPIKEAQTEIDTLYGILLEQDYNIMLLQEGVNIDEL